ncbi:hypothetical protein CBF73_07885, partial [Lactobacillus taiwanensis]|uniref:hypothetical protein n=1 Tax=Lactobacillus taiwanensis TaxID=508451 RepID=UPI000BDC2183
VGTCSPTNAKRFDKSKWFIPSLLPPHYNIFPINEGDLKKKNFKSPDELFAFTKRLTLTIQ